jgi:hypothetical protein
VLSLDVSVPLQQTVLPARASSTTACSTPGRFCSAEVCAVQPLDMSDLQLLELSLDAPVLQRVTVVQRIVLPMDVSVLQQFVLSREVPVLQQHMLPLNV